MPGDRNDHCGDNHDQNCSDVFVKDLTTGGIRLVSTAADGEQANSGSDSSYEPHISGNGRYVTFNSSATNLVGDDTNGSYDAFVKDTRTGGIRRVSTDAQGRQATGNSFTEGISADSRYRRSRIGRGKPRSRRQQRGDGRVPQGHPNRCDPAGLHHP